MAKTTSQSQGSFSFFDEMDKVDPLPQPKKHVLRPPAQIEVVEDEKTAFEKVEEALPVAEQPEPSAAEQIDVAADTAVEEAPEDDLEEQVETEGGAAEFSGEDKVRTGEKAAVGPANDVLQDRRSPRGRKSVKEHSLAAEMIEMPGDDVLYAKQYYSMGEVTAMFKENHSLIRYWESEFDILKPKKNGKGDRFFRPVDVKNLYLIYDLLRRRKFTIEGARDYLKNNKKADEKFAAVQSLEKIKAFFLELKASL
jgi:DNA-binding transcriptional MerR regulator